METALLVQPWIATRTITDYCRLCYQARQDGAFLGCKRAHLAGFNSLLATMRMDTNPQFGQIMKHLEDAKETCLSNVTPDEHCYSKMQNTLQNTLQLYDQMLEEYKSRYAAFAARPSAIPPM